MGSWMIRSVIAIQCGWTPSIWQKLADVNVREKSKTAVVYEFLRCSRTELENQMVDQTRASEAGMALVKQSDSRLSSGSD